MRLADFLYKIEGELPHRQPVDVVIDVPGLGLHEPVAASMDGNDRIVINVRPLED